ncbi:alpha/beta hydrolase [Candidatus Hecatella orcuttiae]|jgi:pimeloyl-ACP methyl ester carboxylesterase|uniref:alpha/beta fold hydrolase n=1 Tax=Candidatus Hecatella orcuttiae TaxID=1935119 RepID=UPI0028681BF8|nr:alpha/beta hydrolase [Candidatus Hecatella orcuttiae]
MRGFGLSDRPLQEYSIELWADDLKGLLEALNIPRTHVHRASMGGMVAMQFALKYPEKLEKLIISCSACKMDEATKLLFKVWGDVAEKMGVNLETLSELTSLQALS